MGSCWQCGVTMNSHKEVELVLRRKGVNGSGPELTEQACFPERFLCAFRLLKEK